MSLATHESVSTTASGAARLDVVPLTKHIGAEIRGIDLREKPDEETVRAIYQAWLDHLVLIFPEQKLSQEDLIRATGFFGEPGKLTRPPKYFPKGYSQDAARHHADLQYPRERRADRRAARRRDDVPPRHDPRRGAEQGDDALLGRDSLDRRQHAVRQRLRRLRHARSGDPATSSKAGRRCTTTITARPSRATAAAPRPSPSRRIRCSAPTRTPAGRRSTSTG